MHALCNAFTFDTVKFEEKDLVENFKEEVIDKIEVEKGKRTDSSYKIVDGKKIKQKAGIINYSCESILLGINHYMINNEEQI